MRFVDRSLIPRVGSAATALALSGFVALTPVARAQEVTPSPIGEVVSAEECTTAARPARFLADLIATPVAATPTPAITALPEGTEPDDQTREEITAVVRQLVACSNTGDLLRALALFGDDYLRRSLTQTGALTIEEMIERIAALATPIAMPPALLVSLVEIRDMRVLPDGRVVAVVVTHSQQAGQETSLFFFARVDGGWIIQDAVSNWDKVEAAG
jgi:hypothetical protein